MASLKEIKGRIASVRSTLKITSAMKMVAAAKLHHASQAYESMLPYQKALQMMLSRLQDSVNADSALLDWQEATADALAQSHVEPLAQRPLDGAAAIDDLSVAARPVRMLVLFTSNSSLCGSFNANVIKRFLTLLDELHAEGYKDDDIRICTIGKKGADAVRKTGMRLWIDCSTLADHPTAKGLSELADRLQQAHEESHSLSNGEGKADTLLLVYNHYASNASQPTRVEEMPFPSMERMGTDGGERRCGDFIVEPSCKELLAALQPRVFRQKLYSTLLDAQAAEHAARTVAMQTASDNADNLLEELTLEYNKSRQQKITAEILDLVGGQKR